MLEGVAGMSAKNLNVIIVLVNCVDETSMMVVKNISLTS